MPTFQLISSVTVGAGGASSIDFTSIPATYTDLCILYSARGTRSEVQSNAVISFNGSTSNFSAIYLQGVDTTVNSATYARFAGNHPAGNSTANTFGNTQIYIPNYAGSTNKSYSVESVSENNAASAPLVLIAGLWSNTAAITSINIASGSSDTIVQYSTFYLYGIKNS